MLYGSANRDPREYGETADRLDVRREVGRHLAFSSGPHFCIGNHLARLQARVAVEELFAAHPHVTVDPAPACATSRRSCAAGCRCRRTGSSLA